MRILTNSPNIDVHNSHGYCNLLADNLIRASHGIICQA